MVTHDDDKRTAKFCRGRRAFLIGSGATIAGTMLLPPLFGMDGKALAAEVARYPNMRIGSLSQLKRGKPLRFRYPNDVAGSASLLIKLGEPAGGGIGPDRDIVAFNSMCTHMGAPMSGSYQAEHQVLGPCPFHQSTFDLTRHDIVISGHATESLPQVLLETQGDDIYAVGLIGLIYGRYDNLKT